MSQTEIQQDEPLAKLVNISVTENQEKLTVYIQQQVAQAIGIDTSQLDIHQPLNFMGIDSLVAAKLRNRMRLDLKIDITTDKFMGDFTIASLATALSESLNTNQVSLSTFFSQIHISNLEEPKEAPNQMCNDDWLEGEI